MSKNDRYDANRPIVLPTDPELTKEEALSIAQAVEKWNGGFARVLVNNKPIGYRPYNPPPADSDK